MINSPDRLNTSRFPINPVDMQEYIDEDNIIWKYNGKSDSWNYFGPTTDFPLATSARSGLLSPQFKLLLDTIAQFPGAFGIIVDKPYKQVVQGDINFVSNSVEINCLNQRGVELVGENVVVDCNQRLENEDPELSSFEVSLRQDYLERLCIDIPAPKGKKGKVGEVGEDGEPGFGSGPKGETGIAGPSVSEILTRTY